MSDNDYSTILEMLYEAYSQERQQEPEAIKAAFATLYEFMHGLPLQESDRIIYPVCTLCSRHEEQGFIDGVRFGVRLAKELIG